VLTVIAFTFRFPIEIFEFRKIINSEPFFECKPLLAKDLPIGHATAGGTNKGSACRSRLFAGSQILKTERILTL
jgi:hypothetical protein